MSVTLPSAEQALPPVHHYHDGVLVALDILEGRRYRLMPPVVRRTSADVQDARPDLCLSWRLRLCRKLKHCCLLTLMQVRQENKRAIREFECVVMHLWYVLVDLSKDRRPGAYCYRLPAIDTGRIYHLGGKGELRSGKNADRRCGILRCGKPTCTGVEVAGRKLVTDLCGA